MSEQDTSAYWRKLLRLDEEIKEDILKEFNYPQRILRPVLHFIVRALFNSYIKLKAFGVENIPASPPYIIAPNHASAADYPAAAFSMPKKAMNDLYVLVTKLFYDIAFTRFFIKAFANAARIDTVDDFMPALRTAAAILKLGKSIYINPEGVRSETGELLPFRVGVGVLAVESGVPIVPVYIDGAQKVLPTGSIFPKPGRINVYFGKPIDTRQYKDKKEEQNAYYVYKEVTDELRRRVEELKERSKKA